MSVTISCEVCGGETRTRGYGCGVEYVLIHKCKDCGIDLLQLTSDERYSHAENHVLNGGDGGWHTAQEQVQVGTRTVDVPEKSHYETVVVKEAWTEKVLVKEAGWY